MEKNTSKGRPKKELDREQVYKLALMHCNMTEMSDFFGVDVKTLRVNYSQEILKGKAEGKIRLRKKQFEVAEKGNCSMLIWLGKQVLNQSDQQNGDDFESLPLTDIV
jgi:hypothetical protein